MSMKRPVYPRWRGELSSNEFTELSGVGLSPLARGTLDQAHVINTNQRFIPAGAGNSSRISCLPVAASVYPRWRGELVVASVFSY